MSEKVRQMFADISPKYDLMNDILSFGLHRRWRKKLVKMLNLHPGASIVDLASGTGDLAFELKKKAGNVTGTDFCEDMLVIARQKAKKRNINVEFVQADAQYLPFDDDQFNAATISFGIRNVDNVCNCLMEMARVVKPNGKVAILEFGQPEGFFAFFYKIYGRHIMPILGKIFASDVEAYTYLPETAAKFPCGKLFKEIMDATDSFSESKAIRLSFGICYIYIGKVK